MGKVYRNKKEVPIPEFAYVNNYDARVYIIENDSSNKSHQRIIGYATSKKTMAPNQTFRNLYPDLWNEAYPTDKAPLYQMKLGLYALTLSIVTKIELYGMLQDVYGLQNANSILDYAMFSIVYRSNVTQVYEEVMADHVIFSDKLYSDTWYSGFFCEEMSEDQNHQLRIRWVMYLVAHGLTRVWICLDGSNNDCEVEKCELAEYGHPKSHNENKKIIGYMYAVDADTGRPITYFTYEGSVPDSQAFQKIATFLGGFQISVEGVILDRGFATENVLSLIDNLKWKYVIMLPGDTFGHVQMVNDYASKIRWKSQFSVGDGGLFGISDKKQLFVKNPRISTISTFFDGVNGSRQSIKLIKDIKEEKKRLESCITNGKQPEVPKGFKKYLSALMENDKISVRPNYDEWDKSMNAKGFYSMATSDGISPEEADRLYKKRDVSETQFMILKSQEGCHATRVHKTPGILSKFAISFISSIIRFEIEKASKAIDTDTNPEILKLDRIALLYMPNGSYSAVKNMTIVQKALFAQFNILPEDLDYFAQTYNHRKTHAVHSQIHTLPDRTSQVPPTGRRKRGRPRKIVPEESINPDQPKEKSKGGRPKGSKDKKPRKTRSDKGKMRKKKNQN